MGKSVRDVLICTLENLGGSTFKRFKVKLNEWDVIEGYSKIPKSRLENKDECDVAGTILEFYTESYGVQVVSGVLDHIDQKKAKEDLWQELKKVKGFVSFSPSEATNLATGDQRPSRTDVPADDHFIDRNRVKLIDRMYTVDPVLDELLQDKLLTSEQYSIIRSKTTPQNQMRELYEYIRAWGNRSKDTLYQILCRNNRPLIEDLESH